MKLEAVLFIPKIFTSMSDNKHLILKFKDTLLSLKWLESNREGLINLFPETWTHVANINPLKIMFNFKLLGVDWRSEEEFKVIMDYLVDIKFILRDGLTIRKNTIPLDWTRYMDYFMKELRPMLFKKYM